MLLKHALVVLTMLSPIAESRGGIPLGLVYDMNPMYLLALTVVTAFVIYVVYRALLEKLYNRILSHWAWFTWVMRYCRTKGERTIHRYGYWGLLVFVAVPVPTTGVYAGTLVSWYLGMSWLKTALAMTGGALISGVITTSLCMGVIGVLQ